MESPVPFDLNDAIRRWQYNLSDSPAFKAGDLEELESHLRVSVETLRTTGLNDEEAFLVAARRLGDAESLRQEFAKVNPGQVWLNRATWMLGGILLSQIIIPLANVTGFFAFVVARNFLPMAYAHLHLILGILVILAVGTAIVFTVCRLATGHPRCWRVWFHRFLNRPLMATLGLMVLLEGLHALDAAVSRTSTHGLPPPSAERSLFAVVRSTQRFVESIEAGQRPFGSGAMLYSLLQYAPQIILLGAFVWLVYRGFHRGAPPIKAD